MSEQQMSLQTGKTIGIEAADEITVLVASKRMVKTWRADGGISTYDEAKNFSVESHRVTGIEELSKLLVQLESNQNACIIRGEFVGFEEACKLVTLEQSDKVFRRNSLFKDEPLHIILIEVDDFVPKKADPLLEPNAAIEEYITTCLPPEFCCASYHWQLSNSAGRPDKRHLLKVHLWFWLHTPYTSGQLRAWATAIGLKSDHSVFQKIQCHYTGRPVFEPGVIDPLPVRCGYVSGLVDDAVCLDIGVSVAKGVEPERATRAEMLKEAAHKDPVAQRMLMRGLVKNKRPDGGFNIICPFEDEHSPGESSESSTAYWPAHTGGYEQGGFSCKHEHCSERSRQDFLSALDILDDPADDFEGVSSPRRPRTATEILDQKFSPIRWVVPKVLPEGVFLLVASPKIGKSWLALQLVLAVATGTEVLGQTVEMGAALYLALEDNDRRLQSRLKELDAEMLLSGAQGAALQFETQWPLANEGGAQAIGDWLTAHPTARLVVVDVLERFRPRRSSKGNLYTEDYDALRALKSIADEHRVAILVVHHTRKAKTEDPLGMVSGTQGLAGSADGILMLERARGDVRGKLHVIGRDIEEDGEYVVEFEGCRWSMVGTARSVAPTFERQEILDVLEKAGGGLTAAEVADGLGKKRTSVARLLTKMVFTGDVSKEGHKYLPSLPYPPVTVVTE